MKIGILTGGGDCPGLNAVIRAFVKAAVSYDIEVVGIRDGFKGLIEGHFMPLGLDEVRGILPRGGTILGTSNRDNPFYYPRQEGADIVYRDETPRLFDNVAKAGLDRIVIIGGDGTMHIGQQLFGLGLNVIGVPKTIDNDLGATDVTFGFQTAVETATEAIDRLHTTAESHHRIMLLELMGRDAGFISLYAGIAGGADVILIPEIPFTLDGILTKVWHRAATGRHFSIIVVAEGCKFEGKTIVQGENVSNPYNTRRLGGIGEMLRVAITEASGLDVRNTVLGHLQRGGSPVAFDRVLASRYGVAALEAARAGKDGHMVCLDHDEIRAVPLAAALQTLKSVDPKGNLVATAKALGISFGETAE